MAGLSSLSPQATFIRAVKMLRDDFPRLIKVIVFVFVIPYPIVSVLYGYYFRLAHIPHHGTAYVISHYGYVLAVELIDLVRYLMLGQIMFDREAGVTRSGIALISSTLVSLGRACWFVLPLSLAENWVFDSVFPLTLPFAALYDFFLPAYVFERMNAAASFANIGRLLRGRAVPVCTTYVLFWLIWLGVEKFGVHSLSTWLSNVGPWYVHALAMTPIHAAVSLFSTAWPLAIYLSAMAFRPSPATQTAEIFS